MHGPLRHIALTVEQSDNGGYRWLLLESADGRLFVLERSAVATSTYLQALQRGFDKLAMLSASGLWEAPGALSAQSGPFPRLVAEAAHHA